MAQKLKTIKRRRGTAIVKTPRGILLTYENGKFLLSGGKAEPWESREEAVVRELFEETGLTAVSLKFLFEHIGDKKIDYKNRFKFRDHHKVFEIFTIGTPRPDGREVQGIGYSNEIDPELLSESTKKILEKIKWK